VAELHVLVRTPQAVVLEARARTLRVPSPTGQVGLRPREESLALVVEPGLILVETGSGKLFVASAGGLLEADRHDATLYTPYAVVGGTPAEVLRALEQASQAPDGELRARQRLAELEQRIVHELKPRVTIPRFGSSRG
jgi:F0F1-type ATP synthase epsilon subunit